MTLPREPLRLGISGSAFIYAMPEEILTPAYRTAIQGRPHKLDRRQNEAMADFMRDMIGAINGSGISAMECYHSLAWDNETILDVVLDSPRVEFWSVHAPYGRYIDPSSPDDESREGAFVGYSDAVQIAARLGAKVVVAHPGANVQYDVPKGERLRIAASTIRRVAEQAGEVGVNIAVEPLPKQEPGNTLDEVLSIVDMVDLPNVGINFDVNHLFPPEDIPTLIRKAGEKILSVHISDQDGQERHWLPFEGVLDWAAILSALTDVGYEGPLIYETHIKSARTCTDVCEAVVENYARLIGM